MCYISVAQFEIWELINYNKMGKCKDAQEANMINNLLYVDI